MFIIIFNLLTNVIVSRWACVTGVRLLCVRVKGVYSCRKFVVLDTRVVCAKNNKLCAKFITLARPLLSCGLVKLYAESKFLCVHVAWNIQSNFCSQINCLQLPVFFVFPRSSFLALLVHNKPAKEIPVARSILCLPFDVPGPTNLPFSCTPTQTQPIAENICPEVFTFTLRAN